MRPLRVFKDFNDGFLLFSVRQFMTEGVNVYGEYDLKYSPLPKVDSVIQRLREMSLILAKSPELKYFKKVHLREFLANRVYGRASNSITYCWLDQQEKEVQASLNFNCARERELLWHRSLERVTSKPTGYTGELCFLAIKPGFEAQIIYRR
jgi:hypothetical protein